MKKKKTNKNWERMFVLLMIEKPYRIYDIHGKITKEGKEKHYKGNLIKDINDPKNKIKVCSFLILDIRNLVGRENRKIREIYALDMFNSMMNKMDVKDNKKRMRKEIKNSKKKCQKQ